MAEESTTNPSPEDKEKLLAELKKRLKEIEDLKAQLGMSFAPEEGEKKEEEKRPYTPESVRDALEELVVPPLELLEDNPHPPKKKKVDEHA